MQLHEKADIYFENFDCFGIYNNLEILFAAWPSIYRNAVLMANWNDAYIASFYCGLKKDFTRQFSLLGNLIKQL